MNEYLPTYSGGYGFEMNRSKALCAVLNIVDTKLLLNLRFHCNKLLPAVNWFMQIYVAMATAAVWGIQHGTVQLSRIVSLSHYFDYMDNIQG